MCCAEAYLGHPIRKAVITVPGECLGIKMLGWREWGRPQCLASACGVGCWGWGMGKAVIAGMGRATVPGDCLWGWWCWGGGMGNAVITVPGVMLGWEECHSAWRVLVGLFVGVGEMGKAVITVPGECLGGQRHGSFVVVGCWGWLLLGRGARKAVVTVLGSKGGVGCGEWGCGKCV